MTTEPLGRSDLRVAAADEAAYLNELDENLDRDFEALRAEREGD
jgi:hypothetical protein